MKAEHLKEAGDIVSRLAWIDTALSYALYPKTNQLSVRSGEKGSEVYLSISKEVSEAALEMQKADLRKKKAELLRRAAQIWLVLACTTPGMAFKSPSPQSSRPPIGRRSWRTCIRNTAGPRRMWLSPERPSRKRAITRAWR